MKKGFLFTITVFLILTYILLSISIWVKSVETEERAFAEFYRESALELALEQLTVEEVGNVSDIIMLRSLYRLNEHAIDHPVLPGPAGDEDRNLEDAMHSLLMNGSADGSYFLGGSEIEQDRNSSLSGWLGNMNASLSAIGIFINEFEVDNFGFYHLNHRTLRYSYDLTISMSDSAGRTSLSRTYDIDSDIDLTGFVDPASARRSEEIAGIDYKMYRQFFFGPYSEVTDIPVPDKIDSIESGQGWFYGYLVNTTDAADVPSEMRKNFILVGDYSDVIQYIPHGHDEFGAYILTNAPSHTPSQCGGHQDEHDTLNAVDWETQGLLCVPDISGAYYTTSQPVVVAPGFSLAIAPDCPELWQIGTGSMGKCALIMAANSPSEVASDPSQKFSTPTEAGIYDIEGIRDFLMCAYYVKDPEGPSYFQRLMTDSFSRNDTEYGISTVVIGEYANSTDFDYSRLDRELFAEPPVSGILVRGMTGCKNFEMCSDDPSTGIFRLSQPAIDLFGLEDIACNNGLARCN